MKLQNKILHKVGVIPPGHHEIILANPIGLGNRPYLVSSNPGVAITGARGNTLYANNTTENPVPYVALLVPTTLIPWGQLFLKAQELLGRFVTSIGGLSEAKKSRFKA